MKYYIINCFAEEKYDGNPLLVVIADRFISEEEQQRIAREINFSETAFILSPKEENGGYNVRIWTPNVGEVPFAGHPSIGTAHVIHNYIENNQNSKILLNLKVGQIPVEFSEGIYTMKQNAPVFDEIIKAEDIAHVFEIPPSEIRTDFPVQLVSTGLEAVIIPLKSKKTLSKINVNKDLFKEYINIHPKCNCNHLFFVDTENNTFSARCIMEDFVEDAATGSANGCMAGYMIKHNYFKSKDVSYTVYQGEDIGRKSILKIKANEQNGNFSIYVGGKCHTIAVGDWI